MITHPFDSTIQRLYLTVPVKTLAAQIGKSQCYVSGRMKKLQLVVPEEIIAQRRLMCRFKKGDVPVTKGKKQTDYMTADAIERTKKTRFQKGGLPHNTREGDGAISIRKDNRNRPYKWIRIALGKWVMLHVHTWEQTHGLKSEGSVIRFIDGDTLNCNITNLEMVTRATNLRKNQVQIGRPRLSEEEKAKRKAAKLIQREEKRAARLEASSLKKEEHLKQRAAAKSIAKKMPLSKPLREEKPKGLVSVRMKQPDEVVARQKAARKEMYQPQFNSKQVDYSQKILVRIDHKTCIYANVGEDIEQVKANYFRRYGNSFVSTSTR